MSTVTPHEAPVSGASHPDPSPEAAAPAANRTEPGPGFGQPVTDTMAPAHDPVGTVADTAPDKDDLDVNQPWDQPFNPLVAVAAGTSEPAARFRFDVVTGSWWWSPGMFALHGFEAGDVEPSTDLLMAHKHPEDLLATEDTLRGVLTTGEPFCCRHRVVDAHGRIREVLSVGEGFCDDDGNVIAVQGYFVDLTDAFSHAGSARPQTPTSLERVIALEQAKGILIGAFRLTAGAALELLRWRSEETGTEVELIAQGLVAEFVSVEEDDDLSPARRACTYLGLKPLEDD
jgi:hypothetical protein